MINGESIVEKEKAVQIFDDNSVLHFLLRNPFAFSGYLWSHIRMAQDVSDRFLLTCHMLM